jgi:hypothetical protein
MLEDALSSLRQAHQQRHVDLVFVYASGVEITPSFVRAIREEVGAPVVNMCLDDKQSWSGPVFDEARIGQIDIAAEFDVSWTSASVACEWYLAEGARPVYMPEGFDQRMYRPMALAQDIPVSFIGANYGFRRAVVEDLRAAGIDVQVFGPGWGTKPIWGDEQVAVINRSIVNLGMGGIGHSESLTNVKTRDFEIPGTGGGAYVTTYNADLSRHFEIGREILCYRNREELIEIVRRLLRRPEEARQHAALARARCLAEHRWYHRYVKLLEMVGVLERMT